MHGRQIGFFPVLDFLFKQEREKFPCAFFVGGIGVDSHGIQRRGYRIAAVVKQGSRRDPFFRLLLLRAVKMENVIQICYVSDFPLLYFDGTSYSVQVGAGKRPDILCGDYLLHGSENLCEMVDWGTGEKDSSGSYNFNTPLFRKLMYFAHSNLLI